MNTEDKNSHVRVHFFYVVLILLIVVILLITFQWTDLDGFTDYLAVATGITSLVLGVLAIIYSFISSGAMSNFLGSVGRSTEAMLEITDKINSSLEKGESLQKNSERKTDELHSLTVALAASIKKLEENTGGIIDSVAEMPKQLGRLFSSTPSDQHSGDFSESGVISAVKKARDYEAFLGDSSLTGVAALKFLVECHKKNCYFDFSKIFQDVGSNKWVSVFSYIYGFVMAVDAWGGISLKQKSAENVVYSVDKIDEEFIRAIDIEWGKRLSTNRDGGANIYQKSINSFIDKIRDEDILEPSDS